MTHKFLGAIRYRFCFVRMQCAVPYGYNLIHNLFFKDMGINGV
ncbi:Hypothetical protein I595_984 [Croceitalea dokdonensis DOKDO 023]|uniref:Uncharacterized protein n=1 Tax=Croceitalea dokdonensis DOKDO 023 TaxID=1300341 RepID=A0A0P7AVE5_9FLAO|nr:Hypothetical protein I595_984 [Croceitalea dokdonensis DOKDO 023]